jgi:SAM-dependent methyltransferase
MIQQDYIEYSNITQEEFNSNVTNSSELIKQDLESIQKSLRGLLDLKQDPFTMPEFNKFKYILSDSVSFPMKSFTYDIFKLSFNVDKSALRNKIYLFSPQFFSLVKNSNYKTFLEHVGGLGILSEVIKEENPEIKVTYSNIESDIFRFFNWRLSKNQLDIESKQLEYDFKIVDKYDVIVSDGILQYLNSINQENFIKNIVNSVNKDGLFCLLADISGKNENVPLYYDVDITKIHSILEYSDMNCIYGKNTFSSLWKKVI